MAKNFVLDSSNFNSAAQYVELEKGWKENVNFVIAMTSEDGFARIYFAHEGRIIIAGGFSYTRFVRNQDSFIQRYRKAFKLHLDLSIKYIECKLKGQEPSEVPNLSCFPQFWDKIYKMVS